MEWNQKTVKLKNLHENEKNPRRISKHDADQLEKSISRFGLCEPLVVNVDNTIIGGHQRYRMLKKLGYKEVAVYVPSEALGAKEAEELGIRLNRNNGEFDYDLIANNFDVDDLIDWGFSLKDLHLCLEDESKEEKDCKPATLTITFSDVDHLPDAETKIAKIIMEYQGATYKVKK